MEQALTLIGQIAAETSGRRELAAGVFRCALARGEGDHADYLAKNRDQLLRGKWKPD